MPSTSILRSAETGSVSIRVPSQPGTCHAGEPPRLGVTPSVNTLRIFQEQDLGVSSTLTSSPCSWARLCLGKGNVYLWRPPGVSTFPPASIPLSSSNWTCSFGQADSTPPAGGGRLTRLIRTFNLATGQRSKLNQCWTGAVAETPIPLRLREHATQARGRQPPLPPAAAWECCQHRGKQSQEMERARLSPHDSLKQIYPWKCWINSLFHILAQASGSCAFSLSTKSFH